MMLLIRDACLVTMTGARIDPGYLWIDPPRIRALGPGDPPPEVIAEHRGPVWQAQGSWILPGFIDAHCHIGLLNDGLVLEGDDVNEPSDPVTPQLLAVDGLFHDDRCFAEALASGVTTVMTGPGSANVLSGQFALLHTRGRSVSQMLIRPVAAMKAALGENPKKVHRAKDRSPMTRMANAAVLRESLQKAQHYRSQIDKAARQADQDLPAPDARWAALLPVLDGRLPLKIHAHRSDDLLTAMRLANEFGLRYTLDHCTEGYLIADLIAAEFAAGRQADHGTGIPGKARLEGVVTGPLLSDRSKPELSRASIVNPAVLAKTGVPMAIMTDHPVVPQQYLSLSAAVAMRGGLAEDKALAAITLDAARICGIDDELGSLAPGKRADIAIFDAHPFDYRSRARAVLIDGAAAWQADDSDWKENR